MSFKQLTTIIYFLLITASISAQVPNTINYQGRLTDASSSPVADGAYLVKFIIYDAPTAGTDLWNTGFQTINTVDGLFTYQLGSNVTLPSGIFSDTNRYLGITVGTDPELSPRTRFSPSSYAFNAATADNVAWSHISSMPSGFADGVDNEGISQLGDTLKGSLYFDGDNNGTDDGSIRITGNVSDLLLKDNGNLKSMIWGDSYGEVDLYNTNGDLSAKLRAGSGGDLLLSDNSGTNTIRLYGNSTGNNSVQLPTDAVNSNEILNESGITSSLQSFFVSLTDTLNMTDIVTTSITIPAPGYIFLYSKSYVVFQNSTNGNFAYLQIDESAGGGSISSYLTLVGDDNFVSIKQFFRSANCHRVYYKPSAGTYTFRVEGKKNDIIGADVSVYNSILTAIYIPTSYGTVSAVSSQPPTDAEATQVTMTNPDGTTSQGYKYDLRDVELRVKKAEVELLKAQHERDALFLKNQRNRNDETNK